MIIPPKISITPVINSETICNQNMFPLSFSLALKKPSEKSISGLLLISAIQMINIAEPVISKKNDIINLIIMTVIL